MKFTGAAAFRHDDDDRGALTASAGRVGIRVIRAALRAACVPQPVQLRLTWAGGSRYEAVIPAGNAAPAGCIYR